MHALLIRIPALIAIAVVTLAASPDTRAQTDKPGRIVVGGPPGSSLDLMARLFADRMRESAGRQYIVDNRPGASSTIAADAVARGAPDGSVLLISPLGPLIIEPLFASNIKYDAFRDFTPISQISTSHVAYTIGQKVPATTLAEYFALARADRKQAFYGTAGTNGLPFFFALLVAQTANVKLTNVPYKSALDAVNALVSGEVPAGVLPMQEVIPVQRRGQARIVATSGARRSALLPEIPTFKELGYQDLEAETWFGFFGPAKMPAALADTISKSVATILKQPETSRFLSTQGAEAVGSTPQEFAQTMRRDKERWTAAIKASGVKLD
ncbi:MAG: Bug family tripartite tricarboxylate transporter substrate binding protein [Burkholderiales bacterium]